MQNTTHFHRHASNQSLHPPTSTRFGGAKSTDRLITPLDLKITKLLSLREDRVCRVTASENKQLAGLTYWDDHTGADSLTPRRHISRFTVQLWANLFCQDDRGFVLQRTLVRWATIRIWMLGLDLGLGNPNPKSNPNTWVKVNVRVIVKFRVRVRVLTNSENKKQACTAMSI